ncbi:MAG: hypothetical protein ACPGC2_00745 [Flavobacteriaceae bacterium]
MEKEKIIHSTAEKKLMSLAHEILRQRNRMSIADLQSKALAIIELTSPSEEEEAAPVIENSIKPTALEEALQQPVKEVVFEPVPNTFVERLFEGSVADYQRVMSMLNSKENAEQARVFIEQQIQPDYNWSDKQKDVDAFLAHIAVKFVAR